MFCFDTLTDDEKKGIFGSIYDGIMNGLKSVTNMILGNYDDDDDDDQNDDNPYSEGIHLFIQIDMYVYLCIYI